MTADAREDRPLRGGAFAEDAAVVPVRRAVPGDAVVGQLVDGQDVERFVVDLEEAPLALRRVEQIVAEAARVTVDARAWSTRSWLRAPGTSSGSNWSEPRRSTTASTDAGSGRRLRAGSSM